MGTASGRAHPGTDWQRCARLPGFARYGIERQPPCARLCWFPSSGLGTQCVKPPASRPHHQARITSIKPSFAA